MTEQDWQAQIPQVCESHSDVHRVSQLHMVNQHGVCIDCGWSIAAALGAAYQQGREDERKLHVHTIVRATPLKVRDDD